MGNIQLHEIVPALIALTVAFTALKVVGVLRTKSTSAKKSVGVISGITIIVLSGCFLLMYSCAMAVTFRSRPVVSPNEEHIARIIELDAGAMDSFHTTVEVRSRWHLYPDVVFDSENYPKDVEAKWASNSELVIRYASSPDHNVYAQCVTLLRDLKITCQPWNNPAKAD